MRRLVLAMILLTVTACDTVGGGGRDWDTARLDDVRVDLDPGESLQIPIVVDSPGLGSVEMTVAASVVSHGPTLELVPELELEPASGDVTRDAGNPLSLHCADSCEGEHTLTVALPEEALLPVTVGLSFTARREGEGLTIQAEPPTSSTVWQDPAPDLAGSRAIIAGRLHITSPLGPRGELRLEVPMADVQTASRTVIVDDSGRVSDVAPGSSVALSSPPGTCGEVWCDWSLGVASVVPWRVTATSDEFDVSFSEADRSVVLGRRTWTGVIEGGETVDLLLDISTPAGQGTTAIVAVRTVFLSEDRWPHPDVVITFGGREIEHTQVSIDATRVFVPLEWGADRCRGSVPASIDATAREEDLELEVNLSAARAHTVPVTGQIEVELQP